MNEKIRFGKRYVQLEDGTWKYLKDTMAEEEYRDKMHERAAGFKCFLFYAVFVAAVGYMYKFHPDTAEAIASNPVVIGITIALSVVLGLFILFIVGVMLYLFVPEMIRAFKRDILGMDEE